MEAAERHGILLARTPEPERAADEDRPVPPWRRERVHGLHEERRRQPLARRLLPTALDHVAGDVAAVHVEPGAQVGDQQASGAAGDVQCRPAVPLDVPLEVRDLVRPEVVVELGPPRRDESVVPRLRIG